MTQKEKLIKATMMANRIRSVANRLRSEARSYDVSWPKAYADELEQMSNDFLKLK